MAFNITEAVAEIISTTNAATYNFGSFTPNANRVLVVMALLRGTVLASPTISNVSGTSLTWTTEASGNNGTDLWMIAWARTPGSTSASVYQVNVTGDSATGCSAYMLDVEDALDWGNPIVQTANGGATSANPAVTFSSNLQARNGYLAAWRGALSSSNPANVSTPPGSWTEVGDNGYATPTTNSTAAYRVNGETGNTVTFTAASTSWMMMACEIRAKTPPLTAWQQQFQVPGIVAQ